MRIGRNGKRVLATLAHTKAGRLPVDFLYAVLWGLPPRDTRAHALTSTQRAKMSNTLTRLHANDLIVFPHGRHSFVEITDDGRLMAEDYPWSRDWIAILALEIIDEWFET